MNEKGVDFRNYVEPMKTLEDVIKRIKDKANFDIKQIQHTVEFNGEVIAVLYGNFPGENVYRGFGDVHLTKEEFEKLKEVAKEESIDLFQVNEKK